MSAGTAYSKRYAGGFADLPSQTTAIDSTFLNAVEAALLQLIGAAPSADGQVAQWDNANTRFGPALILNKNVDPAAAIASSKIDFTGGNALTNAAIAGAAAIARSKLDFGSGLVNADISATAAIAASKLAGYPSDALKSLRGDGSWAAVRRFLVYGTRTTNVATSGTNFAGGADLLASALNFTADGTSDYIITVSAPRVTTGSTTNNFYVALNYDGASTGIIADSTLSNGMALTVRGILVAPAAGAHTVNVRTYSGGAWTTTWLAGVGGGTTDLPILVGIERA